MHVYLVSYLIGIKIADSSVDQHRENVRLGVDHLVVGGPGHQETVVVKVDENFNDLFLYLLLFQCNSYFHIEIHHVLIFS